MTLLHIVYICIHGCRLEICNIIVIIKLDQRDFILGCVLIESYLKNNIRLTVFEGRKQNINEGTYRFFASPVYGLYIKVYTFYTADKKTLYEN